MISVIPVTLFIGSHLFLKIFLWSSLAILALYIFVLEGRVLLTKARISKVIGKVTKKKNSESSGAVIKLSLTEKKINLLTILWASITLLTIVLTVTY